MKYEKRMGAQDLLNQSEPFLGKKCHFEEAFPEVDTIKIDYTESQIGGFSKASDGDMGRRVINDKHSICEYLPCHNLYCCNGGFHIGPIIYDMVRNRKETSAGEYVCQGDEGSPKGRKIYRRCLHKFDYTITINYK